MICVFLLFVISLLSSQPVIAQSTRQTYIVHVNLPADQVPGESQDLETWYRSFLPEVTANSEGPSRIRHAYRNVITGFAAKLSPEEVKEMEKKAGFLHARPERMYALKTTHSPNFLGLYQNLGSWPESNYGKGVIIGVFDTGITPGHPSFDDEGIPPPPARWKGKCELKGTACNNKLIGARNFAGDEPGPPIDHDGHGTHTASTAAGNFVPGANLFGQANGVASGMSPLAHLAIYKVCSEDGCFESDSMAAFDAAIEDGVDLLSISIGGISVPFYEDGIALGAFAAMENGILNIVATALLGNQEEYDGQSVYQTHDFPSTLLPLINAGSEGNKTAELCTPGSLNDIDVKGKVVLCLRGGNVARIAKGQTVKDAGGAAMILMNDKPDAYDTLADPHVLPAAHVSYADGVKIRAYINLTSNPKATILFKGTVIGDKTAPTVASYSSRGPSRASPLILKPDIIGPGSSILAAWPIPVYNNTNVKATFNMISGTSMSCPHLSGIAGLIKSVHPDWSPAMIKSAIMTSATQTNLNNSLILDQRHLPADIFATGAGHVNPSRALDPGLVYDIKTRDYISYLCYMYTENQVAIIVNRKINCGGSVYKGVPGPQLNYPSFAIQLGHRSQTYPRTVTNVGDAKSSYYVQIENVPGVDVTVEPKVLAFTTVNQKKTYTVSFSRQDFTANGSYVQGSIAWISAKHIVRIPISVNLVL
ncbi:UNVERIFIED_CONTAM: Subtilisin-like protease SBT1.7 [Sesamum calycinum]|uniref:Subtilisin-like protease SBT1.7 n=1 Tax=Sesamum calycinum TaxID=2727403 RepID=A0AAW2QZC0_9LAMI